MQHILATHGYLALVVLAFVEACCVPIPSEITFGFGGVLVGEGKLDLVAVLALGTAAEIAGSFVAYGVGRVGGRPLVERLGRYLLVTAHDLDRAEGFFAGHGRLAVLVGRAAPVLRAFVSLAAGIAKMPARLFLLYGGLGTLAYVAALVGLGDALGSAWRGVSRGFSLAGYVVVVVIVLVVVLALWHRVRVVRRAREA